MMQAIFENDRIIKCDYVQRHDDGWEVFTEGGGVSEVVEADLITADTMGVYEE